jgi:predicted extracellular nuclease
MKRLFTLLACAAIVACGGNESAATSPHPTVTGSTAISTVQGTGSSSALEGQSVTVTGIVSGDFQDDDADKQSNLGGFYVQQEVPDANPLSSEGIFVFDGNAVTVDVNVGDRVEIVGLVAEFFGETQLNATSVRVSGSGTIQPTDVSLPTTGTTKNSDGDVIADLERFEGMLIRFVQPLTVTNLHALERFGAVGLSQGGRLIQFTNSNAPGATAYAAHKKSTAKRRIFLDDGARSFNPSKNRYLNAGAAGYSIRSGDTITALTGNLRYSRGSGASGSETWRIMPTHEPGLVSVNQRPGAPAVAGSIRVASFNVLNFFSTIDTGRAACGPRGEDNCRGADSATEFSRQLSKTVSALALLDADIVGLMELENNAFASIDALVSALNGRIGAKDYDYLDTGTINDDAIKTGFIYKTSTVRLRGSFAILDSNVDPRFKDRRNRPALAQTFEAAATGALLTVVVNHLKSKGSPCDSDGDPNTGDGQGNCNKTRTNAAIAMADWIATDPTNSRDDDFLIIGDMNAYAKEDPLTAFRNSGLINLLGTDSYSFVFHGQAGALDHALATASLAAQVRTAIEWHINADEPPLLDYNLENRRDPDLFDPDSPYRASDHDPVVIGLDLSN